MKKWQKIAVSLLAVVLLLLLSLPLWVPLHEKNLVLPNPCIVVLSGGDNGYFIDRETPAGYQLEMLSIYADRVNVPFRFVVENNPEKRAQMLADGEATIAAFSGSVDSLPANADVAYSMPVDTVLRSIWATHADDDKLIQSINMFFVDFVNSTFYRGVKWKYVDAKTKGIDQARTKTSLSKYDEVLKQGSKELGWDWRILASLIYQESRFQHDLTSHKGASGIMQLMPQIVASYGIDSVNSSPEDHIRIGVRYLKSLQRELAKDPEITDDEERIKFVLASYNAGQGRISACRTYARMFNKNAGKWSDVASIIPLLNDPDYYNSDSLALRRFKGGDETLRFVDEIMERYYHYRNLVLE